MIPDTVEVGGSLRGLSEQHFYRLIERATEVHSSLSYAFLGAAVNLPRLRLRLRLAARCHGAQMLRTVVYVFQVMTKAADMHGCTVEVTWRDPPYIPTVNNLDMVSFVEEAAKGLVGEDRWQRLAVPTMAAEDFGFMARAPLTLLLSITS